MPEANQAVDRAGGDPRPVGEDNHEVVKVSGLDKIFHKRDLKALDGVEFTLLHGTFTSIIGPSGCCLLYTSDAADELRSV